LHIPSIAGQIEVEEGRWSDRAMVVARRFSIVNFAIASSALYFQVFVLYPWHEKLDEDFRKLRQEQLRMTQEIGQAHSRELKAIKDILDLSYKR
jgi:hypothetical protein